MRRSVLPFFSKVRWSMRCGCRSTTLAPVSCCNSSTLPTQCSSVPSSEAHSGIGVPQKRERLMLQSRASFSQFSKRFSPTKPGTQCTARLFSTIRSRRASTFTYQEGVAL
jgi:hypothetical protein